MPKYDYILGTDPEQVSAAVQLICDNPGKSVGWFLKKLHIGYDEWCYLSFATIPAMRYRTDSTISARRYANFLTNIQHILYQIQVRDAYKDINEVAKALEHAIEDSRRAQEAEG